MGFLKAITTTLVATIETFSQALAAQNLYFDLNSKSDSELAKRGIQRTDIARVAMLQINK